MARQLSLSLLGTFQAKLNGEPVVTFEYDKVRALLAYLAVERDRPHRRDVLASLLWPEQPDRAARHSLSQALLKLRQALGDRAADVPFILADPKSIQLNSDGDIQVDVTEFEARLAACATHNHAHPAGCEQCMTRRRQAAAFYGGDFLQGFSLPDSITFDNWLALTQERLHRLAIDSLYMLAHFHEECRELDRAQQFARRQVELEPWREEAHRQLMRVLALNGERSAALAQFDACCHILLAELGAEPTATTVALYEQILSGELVSEREAAVFTVSSLSLPLDHLPDPAPLPPGSLMPLSKNPLFVGRAADLQALATALNSHQALTISQVETAAATGLGGIGKTQLASEFVHRYGHYFAGGVYWLSFDNAEAIAAEVAACGDVGALALRPDFGRLTLVEQVRLVRAAWQQPTPRLLVFDNCENPRLLAEWRPPSGGCRVLVTSRRGDWELVLGVKTLALGVLSRPESIALLQKHRPDVAPSILGRIAEELGDLPLALHLAGCYLRRYGRVVSPVDYLAQLQDPMLLHHPSMQGEGISPTGHIQHVGRTFALSYDQLDPTNETDSLALKLLVHAAHFAPGEPIWYRLLVKTLGSGNDPAAALQVEGAFARLIELGLIETERDETRSVPDETLRMHRLVAKFVRDVAREAVVATQQAVEAVVYEETAAVNQSGYPVPLLAWQLHLRAVVDVAQAREDVESARLCAELGHHLWRIGDHEGALPYATKALAIREAILGPEHPDTAESLNLLGNVYLFIGGKVDRARICFERALSIQEAAFAGDDIAIAKSLNLLGLWHLNHGEARRAETFFSDALDICRRCCGVEHALTATYENNLGDTLRRLNKLEEALPHLQRALATNEKLHGSHHPDTAMNLNNIAIVLHDSGQLPEARLYYERALAIRRETLGEEHPETALMLNNLGSILIDLGELALAEELLQAALTTFEKIFTEPHSFTAFSLNNLGKLYRLLGDLSQAQSYFEKALHIRESVIAGDHPLMGHSLRNLGELLAERGQFAAARHHLERALGVYQNSLGRDHDTTQAVQAKLRGLISHALAPNLAGGVLNDQISVSGRQTS